MVKEIEGVGWERAKMIGRRYGNIMSLACADVKELTEVEGVGKVLAGRILNALRGGE